MLVEAEVCNKLLELPVLILKLSQTSQLANTQPAVQFLPEVKCLFRNPYPPQHFCNRRSRLGLLQSIGNLLILMSTLRHGTFLPSKCYNARKLSFKPEEKTGSTSTPEKASLNHPHFI